MDISKLLNDLFPLNRSLTGENNRKTLNYIKEEVLPESIIKSINSGTKVFDWIVPPEWKVEEAYVENRFGEKIIDFKENNLHLVSYSSPVEATLSEEELLKKIHTLPDFPEWIPYRTSYYSRDWGFCCTQNLIKSSKFKGPFRVKIDSSLNYYGQLNWLECYKKGENKEEIIISTYCCHPSMANDNLSGVVASIVLFKYLLTLKTKFSYRLVIAPETIGTIVFLEQTNYKNIIGGMIMSCMAGPGKFSIKEGFKKNHWINKAAHSALNANFNDDYITYPFEPDGSDERQFSSPGFKIVTPSIHKSKYYEYLEYHTSADNLSFITVPALEQSISIHKQWIKNIESYCYPLRSQMYCEFQLGKRGLYPSTGGSINQMAHNKKGNQYKYESSINITSDHTDAFQWIMHLADGTKTNFEISEISNINLQIINDSLILLSDKNLIFLNKDPISN